MKIAQKYYFLFLFLAFASLANANPSRPTSFDNKQFCEESKGNWREFGNSCGNNCTSKFDEYEICATALTYACDCGKNKCWNGEKCVTNSDYKKIYDKENEANKKLLEAKAKARRERFEKDPALRDYLQNLYVQKDATNNNQGAQSQQNQSAQPVTPPNTITQAAPQRAISSENQAGAVTQVVGVQDSANAGAKPNNQNADVKIPPAFLEQEKAKQQKQNAENAKNNAQLPAELPKIPLPTP